MMGLQGRGEAGERDRESGEGVLRFESSEGIIHENIWGRVFWQKESQVQGNWNMPDGSSASKEATVARVQ